MCGCFDSRSEQLKNGNLWAAVCSEEVATVRYEIDFNGWRVEGNPMGWDFDVYSKDRAIIHISKELLHWGDTYVIDFEHPEDELMGMLLVIAIDAANCPD